MITVAAGIVFICASVAVVDGDTFRCHMENGDEARVRIHALHAPEMSDIRGREARATLAQIIVGQQVVCKAVDRDRYGRTVADCEVQTDIARTMIESGKARWCPAYGRYDLHGTPDNGLALPKYCNP